MSTTNRQHMGPDTPSHFMAGISDEYLMMSSLMSRFDDKPEHTSECLFRRQPCTMNPLLLLLKPPRAIPREETMLGFSGSSCGFVA